MKRGGVLSTVAGSPTMVGAITVLVLIVAVFLAYNANAGLPFVQAYGISVKLPNAESLVPGNEVRVGGVRVGQIQAIEPEQDPDTGESVARLDLKLDKDLEPLPDDSTLIVRARSALGLKYLEITKGASSTGFEQGSVIPASAARPEPVELDQVLGTFDEPTRDAIRRNLVEFGNALAGRGPDLNRALGSLPGALEVLEPVMSNLAAPRTGLERWVVAAAAISAEVAPVAEQQAQMFVALDTTLTALARVSRPFLQETISETPPTFAVAEQTMPTIRTFLANSATLFSELRPGVTELAATAPTIAAALETGVPVLRDSPVLNRELGPTAEALRRFNDDAGVRSGLARLTDTFDTLGPTIRFIAPAQTVCNYGSLLFRNLASATSGGSNGGRWQRISVFEPPQGPNNEGSPSQSAANGGGAAGNFLHYNPYPNTASPGQSPRECEAGNEPYLVGQQVIGNVPGNQGLITEDQIPAQLKGSGQ